MPVTRRARATLAAGVVALAIGAMGWVASGAGPVASEERSGPSGTTSASAGPGAHAPDAVLRTAAEAILADRFNAVVERDRAAFVATLRDPGSSYGRSQLAVYDRMVQLPLSGLGATVTAVRSRGDGTFVASGDGRYRLTGYDRGPHTYPVTFTFARTDSGWRLSAPLGTSGATLAAAQPWDLPGMRVVRSRTSLVIGNLPMTRLEDYGHIVDKAVVDVSTIWHRSWPHRVVVVAPATTQQLEAQVEVTRSGDGDLTDVAAETVGSLVPGEVATSDRVVVNPTAFEELGEDGRREVLTHETTHVAVRSSLPGRVPLWLSEGLADFVGYGSIDISERAVVTALTAQVGRDGLPARLPGDGAFSGAQAGAAYNQGWLAVRLIDHEVGTAGLTRFYEAAAATGSDAVVSERTAQAFQAVLRTTEQVFTRRWVTEVARATST